MTTHTPLTDETLRGLFATGLARAAEDRKISVSPSNVDALVAKFRAAEQRKATNLGLGYAHMVMRSHVSDCLRAVQRQAGTVARDHERAVTLAHAKLVHERGVALKSAADSQFTSLTGISTLSDWSKPSEVTGRMTPKQVNGLLMLWMVAGENFAFDAVTEEFAVTRANAWQRVCRARLWIRAAAQAAGFAEVVAIYCDLPIGHSGGQASESFRAYVESTLG